MHNTPLLDTMVQMVLDVLQVAKKYKISQQHIGEILDKMFWNVELHSHSLAVDVWDVAYEVVSHYDDPTIMRMMDEYSEDRRG